MSVLESFLNMFRRKPGDTPSIDPKETQGFPMRPSTANSITLSPDMLSLFLIDAGRAFYFDLRNEDGIVIGTLNGQLTVATALPDIVPPDDDPDLPDSPKPPDGPDGPIERLIPNPRPRIRRLSTQKTQWTLMFIKDKGVVSIIGASDIDTSIIGASDIDTSLTTNIPVTDGSRSAENPQGTCEIFSFLISESTINIRRSGDTLIIEY